MQSFLNSPQGPLGSAGQSGTSTMPQSLFNNSSGFGSRFGAGIDAFKNRMGTFSQEARENPLNAAQGLFKPGGMLGNIFGGDGGFLNGMLGPKGLGGIPQNLAQIPQNVASIFGQQGLGGIPGNMGQMFKNPLSGVSTPNPTTNGMTNVPGAAPTSGGFGGGGFLSRFMNSGQG
jgi:hypothetical protein